MFKKIEMPREYYISRHTETIQKGGMFFAFEGKKHSVDSCILKALEKKVSKIFIKKDNNLDLNIKNSIKDNNIFLVEVDDLYSEFINQLNAYYKINFNTLHIIAITGTKGKSTTTLITYHFLKKLGFKVACLSTIKNIIDDQEFDTNLTTNQADYIYSFFKVCMDNNITHIVIEVSAQAISSNRIQGLLFDTIIFTNFSSEHLEYYDSLDDYFAAKVKILDFLKDQGTFIYNGDDKRICDWINQIKDKSNTFISFGKEEHNNLSISILEDSFNILSGTFNFNNKVFDVENDQLGGSYNLYNIAASFISIYNFMFNLNQSILIDLLSDFKTPKGRMQKIIKNDINIIIDYAHTESSYEALLSFLKRNFTYITIVFGCGGDRDKTKRPVLTSIAEKYGDQLVITSDNLRNELFESIVEDMKTGLLNIEKTVIIKDRKEAIIHGFNHAPEGSVIAILGKGHEEYQIIGNKKIPFSDYQVIKNI